MTKNVVVIGGGFAGASLVRQLERSLPADWQPVLVSEENYMTFTPLLPEVVGASLLPGHAVAPLRKMLRRTRYFRAAVREIDLDARTVRYGPHSLPYEHLVLACGKVPDMSFVEGMAQHALPLKTLGDALQIRNRMFVSLEQTEMEDDPEARRELTTFIVVGGGSSGVELAGAIADFLASARQYYPSLKHVPGKVILLEGGPRLVSEFPATLGESALASLRRIGIEVRLDARASRITADGLRTDGGEWIAGRNIISTIGTATHPLIAGLALPKEKGLIKTVPDMSVQGLERVWAVGDCAAVMNAETGELSPPTAQFAVQEGTQLARNIVRAVRGEATRPFRYRSRGQLATVGHRRAVAHVLGLKVSGFPAWLMWRAVYLMMLPTLLRKLQVFSEWNLELLFPRDMTQLHFLTSAGSPEAVASGSAAGAGGEPRPADQAGAGAASR